MNSSFPGNNITMTTLNALISTTTSLIGPDNALEVWSREPFQLEGSSTAKIITSTPSTTAVLLPNETMKVFPIFESPIVSAVKLALFMMIHSPIGAACVQSCSNVLKSSLTSIVGPSYDEMLSPFHSVVAKSRTNIAAQRKIAWICHSMRKFKVCLDPCTESKAKALRMITIEQWQLICEASNIYPKHFGEFIGCERRHHDKALQKCPALKISAETSLDSFCRKINDYVDCYSTVPFRCNSKNATIIWTTINGAIKQSYGRILKLTAGRLELPNECEWAMRNTDLYKHEDEDGKVTKEEFLFESLSWSTTTTNAIKTTPIQRSFEPFPSSGPPSTQMTSTSLTHPHHKHRKLDTDEYNVDYWQGISEQPLMQPLKTTTQTTQTTSQFVTSTNNLSDRRTPFLANAFKNGLPSNKCSILWLMTSLFVIYAL
ncbi:hypothetical protein M3Y97_00277800 [Aphelenchoides bicaudatus]|nr:hypothetical protein M3Y97_00277800 [Aphelenchoides bicaudatus]